VKGKIGRISFFILGNFFIYTISDKINSRKHQI